MQTFRVIRRLDRSGTSAGVTLSFVVFGFFKKKTSVTKDPVAVYDGFIESLERQGAEVRKSAATLLALRGDLTRDVEKYEKRSKDLLGRVQIAEAKADVRASRTLRRDLDEAEQMREDSEKALALANEDAQLLLDAAADTARRVAQLKSERQSARARLATGLVVSSALRQQVEHFDKVIALEAARDEVERARALADIYREDVDKKHLPESSS